MVDSERGQFLALMLLADSDGVLATDDPAILARMAGMSEAIDIQRFIDLGLLDGNHTATTRQPHVTLEKEVEKEKENKTRARRASFVGDFEKWWEVFPNKVGRAAALTAFQKVRKAGGVELETLVQGVERYKASKPPDRAWCNPATWLNQARWLDEPATTGSAYRPRAGPVRTYREIREERERHENDVA